MEKFKDITLRDLSVTFKCEYPDTINSPRKEGSINR